MTFLSNFCVECSDPKLHNDFYIECYYAQTLLILLFGPPKEDSALHKLLKSVNSLKDEEFECLIATAKCQRNNNRLVSACILSS